VATNPDLEARLVAQPEIETYLVYGDWLSEHGDPRGELIAVQHALLATPGDRELRAREAALIAANPEWLGALANLPREEFAVQWFCGFVESARILRPEVHVNAMHARDMLGALLDLPGIALLRDLGVELERQGAIDFAPYLAALADRTPPGLRALALICPGWAPSAFRGFTRLSPALGKLRKLAIETSDAARLDTIHIPSLRELSLDCAAMTFVDFNELLAPRWQTLERLELRIDLEETHAATLDDVELLLGAAFPALRHLALVGAPFDDELVDALVASPILPRLETLDL
jgi:uncharacterized protein (TIGR02996 family)